MIDMNNNDNNTPGSDVDNLIRQREFGDRFRVAREAADMSTAEVAEELRLAEDIIKALENSQLDSLPAPTFTQGYIRSYAKMLKLPVDEILKAYDRLIPEKEAPLTGRKVLSAQKDSNDMGIKMITFGLLLAALILLAFWFQQTDFSFINGDNGDEPVSEIDTGQEQVETTGFSENTELELLQAASESTYEAVIESDSINQDMVFVEETVEAEVVEIVHEPAETVDEPSQTTEAQYSIEQNTDSNSAEQTSASEQTKIRDARQKQLAARQKPVITQPVVGNDVLVLITDDESWAEVEDANGARLYFDLMKKDGEYQFQGQAPFMLFLGNAPAVTLGVNNHLLNISAYVRRNNIAHVQISKDGAISLIRSHATVAASSAEENPSQNPETTETTDNLQPALEDE